MSKRMLINIDAEESRAAIVEDGKLSNLEIETINRNSVKGNIYKAVVAKVEPSLQAAFVDFGAEKQGFLPLPEVHTSLYPKGDKRAPIQAVLKAKQEILVQVVRDEIGEKGATLTMYISLPGRYLVLIPDSDKTGISRKLSEGDRDRLKEMAEGIKIPDGFGLIVRTAGETSTKQELAKDLTYLTRMWETIERKYAESKGPTLIHAERSLAIRFVRDYFTPDITEMLVDDEESYNELHAFLDVLMPRHKSMAKLYDGSIPLFMRYQIEKQLEDVYNRRVTLPSGGSIVIDQTEALVAIDVNSGRVKEKDIEDTATRTNVEAAQEIARQAILRDLGGLIVIDFIDMRERKNVRDVEHALREAFKDDKARHKLGHISEFGLLEMSRQRLKSTVHKGSFVGCTQCSGTGVTRTVESTGMSVLRKLHEAVAGGRVRYVISMVPPTVASFLLNRKRKEIAALEHEFRATIEAVAVDGMVPSQMVLEYLEEIPPQTGQERADAERFNRVTQVLDVVRSEVVRREESRMTLAAARPQGKAAIDYTQLYRHVAEATVGVSEEPVARPQEVSKPLVSRPIAPVSVPQPPIARPEPPQIARQEPREEGRRDEDREEEPYRRGGFGSWLKGLFGLSSREPEPEPTPRSAPAEVLPPPPAPVAVVLPPPPPSVPAPVATPPAPLPAPGPGRGDRDPRERGERGDRDRGPRGSLGPRGAQGAPKPGSKSALPPRPVPVVGPPLDSGARAPTSNGDVDEAAGDDPNARRRRRGRRGGRRRRREDGTEISGTGLHAGTEDTGLDAADGDGDDTGVEDVTTTVPMPFEEIAFVAETASAAGALPAGATDAAAEATPDETPVNAPESALPVRKTRAPRRPTATPEEEAERKARLEEARAKARAEIERIVQETQAVPPPLPSEAPAVPAEPEQPSFSKGGRFVIDLRKK